MNWKRAFVATLAAVPLIALFAFGFTRDPGRDWSPQPGTDLWAFFLRYPV